MIKPEAILCLLVLSPAILATRLQAQASPQMAATPQHQTPPQALKPHPPPVTLPHPDASTREPAPEPKDPPPQTVSDPRTGISFSLPAGWNVAHTDGELSNFRLDARTASPRSEVRLVATLAFNPYPASTFAGASIYLTSSHESSAACATQATASPAHPDARAFIADIPFAHGKEQHGKICTETRDEIFTAPHSGSCVRFDLVTNTFCGDGASGAREMTDDELEQIRQRMQDVLKTVRFTSR